MQSIVTVRNALAWWTMIPSPQPTAMILPVSAIVREEMQYTILAVVEKCMTPI